MSLKSANDKGDNGMIPANLHRSPGICLTAEEKPGKRQLGDRLIKAVRPIIASNGAPYLPMKSVRSNRTSGRAKEAKKERSEL